MSHGYPLQQTRGLAPVNHLCPCIDQHIIFKEAERGVGKIEKKSGIERGRPGRERGQKDERERKTGEGREKRDLETEGERKGGREMKRNEGEREKDL